MKKFKDALDFETHVAGHRLDWDLDAAGAPNEPGIGRVLHAQIPLIGRWSSSKVRSRKKTNLTPTAGPARLHYPGKPQLYLAD